MAKPCLALDLVVGPGQQSSGTTQHGWEMGGEEREAGNSPSMEASHTYPGFAGPFLSVQGD